MDLSVYLVTAVIVTFTVGAAVALWLSIVGGHWSHLKAAALVVLVVTAVLVATPIDLSRLIRIPQTSVRVTYGIEDRGEPTLTGIVTDFLSRIPRA